MVPGTCGSWLTKRFMTASEGQEGRPLFGLTGGLTDRIAFALLRLYEKISPGLNTDGVSTEDGTLGAGGGRVHADVFS